MIYLDNAATTLMDPRVLDAMLPYLTDEYGNAGSLHTAGRQAYHAVEEAREKVAALFSCLPGQVIFTSGGTEGNNAVIRHFAYHGRTLLTSDTEHDSVNHCADFYAKLGLMRRLGVCDLTNPNGTVNMDVLRAVRTDFGACSVQYVNNETGAVNPVQEIGELCTKNGAWFHTDCVQAAGYFPINVNEILCDFATVSAHKIHGPKGVGALYVRSPDKFNPMIRGGSEQEFGLRGGTENVAGIVGFGKAVELSLDEMERTRREMPILKSTFYMGLMTGLSRAEVPLGIVHINGLDLREDGRILNLMIHGVDGESLVLAMDAAGVCISAGSACRSKTVQPSHTLTAMGLSEEEARQSVRISFARTDTISEVYDASQIMANAVALLTGRIA